MTADELLEKIAVVRDRVADLAKKHASACRALDKAEDKVATAEKNRADADRVMDDTVTSNFGMLDQLQTAITDYEIEKKRVDQEAKTKNQESRSVASQIQDVVYTAKLIAPEDAEPFEYKCAMPGVKKEKGKHGKIHRRHSGNQSESGRASPVETAEDVLAQAQAQANELRANAEAEEAAEAARKKQAKIDAAEAKAAADAAPVEVAAVADDAPVEVEAASAPDDSSVDKAPEVTAPPSAPSAPPVPSELEQHVNAMEDALADFASDAVASLSSPPKKQEEVSDAVDASALPPVDDDFGSVTRFNEESSMDMLPADDFMTPQPSIDVAPASLPSSPAPAPAPALDPAPAPPSSASPVVAVVDKIPPPSPTPPHMDDNTISTQSTAVLESAVDEVNRAKNDLRKAMRTSASPEVVEAAKEELSKTLHNATALGVTQDELLVSTADAASVAASETSASGRDANTRFESIESLDSMQYGSVPSNDLQSAASPSSPPPTSPPDDDSVVTPPEAEESDEGELGFDAEDEEEEASPTNPMLLAAAGRQPSNNAFVNEFKQKADSPAKKRIETETDELQQM